MSFFCKTTLTTLEPDYAPCPWGRECGNTLLKVWTHELGLAVYFQAWKRHSSEIRKGNSSCTGEALWTFLGKWCCLWGDKKHKRARNAVSSWAPLWVLCICEVGNFLRCRESTSCLGVTRPPILCSSLADGREAKWYIGIMWTLGSGLVLNFNSAVSNCNLWKVSVLQFPPLYPCLHSNDYMIICLAFPAHISLGSASLEVLVPPGQMHGDICIKFDIERAAWLFVALGVTTR